MKKHFIKTFLILLTGLFCKAGICQAQEFDPLLDPACRIVPEKPLEEWESSYMWHPGQLAAHLQKQLLKESKERCTNVGYPGKFYKEADQTSFRKKVTVKKETPFQWEGPDEITCRIDGETVVNTKSHTLPAGTYTLFFDVKTTDRLPCLIIKGDEVASLTGWEASVDGTTWNPVESYSLYNKPGKLPDDKQEIRIDITPRQVIPVRNATVEGEKLIIGEKGYGIIDFFHLEVGTVDISVTGKGNVSFRVGESPEEVLNADEKLFEQNPIAAYRLTGSKQNIRLPERAVRYLLVESKEGCEVSAVKFEAILWPVTFQMKFESNDENMNNLFKAGIATLHTSMHSFYLDGVKRDYLPWSMDAIASTFGGDYVFGDQQVSRNGLSIALMPKNPQVSDFGILDYPLHALVGFKQNYLRYGDLETSLMYKDRIVEMLELYGNIQDENLFLSGGHSSAPSFSGFIPGWATKNGPDGNGTPSYVQIMLYHNYCIGAYFADLWKESSLARNYRQKAESLKKNIMLHFWDEEQKAFINGYRKEGEKDMRISHHAQYWAILAGLFPEEYYDHLFDTVLPAIPFYKEYISYEKGYEFYAYAKAGRMKDIFPFLDAVWGDWLRQGHTRFPENFSPQALPAEQLIFYNRPFGLSLCHGANGVPCIVAVLNGLLGFDQSERKINEYYLNPDLLHLEWIKGEIPVKEGCIKYHFTKNGTSEIEIPKGCVVHIGKKRDKKPARTFAKPGVYKLNI